MTEKTIHQGRNIKRFREMMGIKQEAFADALGEDWNQKKVSLLEAKEVIEPAILEQVASTLKVPTDAIRNFDPEQAINNFNTFYDHSAFNFQCTLNPIEKWIEALEKNEKLVEENRKLYLELLTEKNEKITLLEKMLAGKQ